MSEPVYSVIARVWNVDGDKLTTLVERRDSIASARGRASSLGRATDVDDRGTWPAAVAAAVDGAPEGFDFSTVAAVEYEAVTT